MDFTLTPEINDMCRRIRSFVDEHLLPLESDPTIYDEYESIRKELLDALRVKAKAAGIWALSMPKERGGAGYNTVGMAACYEEMNRALFGPAVFNAAAPDDGNMFVLNRLGNDRQKEKWLQPIIDGDVSSSIVMTEPAPGAGSDPAGMMKTTAEKVGDKWIINGRKWFITGAAVASHFILLARTSTDPRRELTTFLYHKDQPGWRIVRRLGIMGPEEHGGHCEIEFDGLEIPDEDRLLDVGRGMKVVQTRLGTARLTHCMRWLGMAKRAMEISSEYVADREAFGIKLADRESVQLLQGDVAMAIHIGRLMVMNAAWKLDQGEFAQSEVSAAKIQVADTLHLAVDTAIQLCGARGYSKDTVLEWMYRYARQAKLVDGASEVHKMILARGFQKQGIDYWSWN
ncbi:MAG: acyl-CoA dehydrogenase family protein [Rhodospirillales bacterium]|jgi:acyl-CoA dehydrogenase|tara:strand:+ start:711 stop:1910 length:1200 start_codon:yes stop_codon:yes gene_type:complete